MKSIVLIAAFVWAATSPNLPRRVRWYFMVQVVSAVCLESMLLFKVPVNADAYEIAYTVCTLGILSSGFYLAWEALKSFGVRMRLLFLLDLTFAACFLFYLCAIAIQADYHQFPYFLWLTLGEATLLVISGVALALALVNLTNRDRTIASTLAGAWIGKAAILYVYSLNVLSRQQLWYDLGAFLPAILFIVVCAHLGRKLRIDAREPAAVMISKASG